MKLTSFLALALLVVVTQSGCATAGKTQAPALEPPSVFADGARVLFQGDSITDGNRGKNSDPNHILGHGYVFIVAAKYGAGLPERHLVFMNRGISGNRVSTLAKRWQTDTIDLKPDVLSILIGVNDLGSNVSAEYYEQQYDQLLAETVSALPAVRLVLCEPFGLPVGKKEPIWPAYSADLAVRRAIVAKLAAKYHAAFVPFQKAFDDATKRAPADYWIWDGVHPTYSGHQLMADEWVRVVRAFWPDRK